MGVRFAALLAAALAFGSGVAGATSERERTYAIEWSPDGRWLAFDLRGEGGEEQVHVIRRDGTRRRVAFSSSTHSLVDFSWSPNSRRLAIIGREHTWLATADGKPIRRVDGTLYSWSRDGNRFLVTRAGPEVWVLGADGRTARKLVDGSGGQWSPNGRHVAFSRAGNGRCGRSRIFVIDQRDGSERQISPDVRPSPLGGASWDHFAPRWSPDGRNIAYSEDILRRTIECQESRFGYDHYAYVSASTGGPARYLGEGDPRWSPNGKLIALTRRFSSPHVGIVTPSGRGYSAFGAQGGFDWTSRGGRIAYADSPRYGYEPSFVHVALTNGRQLRTLGEGEYPAWSPGGNWVALVRHARCGDRVVLVRPNGSGAHAITRCPRR